MAYTPKIRLFTYDVLKENAVLYLPKEQMHYVKNVMRQAVGDHLFLFNGKHGEWRVVIEEVSKKHLVLRALEKVKEQMAVPEIHLAFALIKPKPLMFLVQKATELGVASLFPLVTQNTVINKVNIERMHANVIEAAEQCERLTVPAIHDVQSLEDYLKSFNKEDILLFCDEERKGEPLHHYLQNNKKPVSCIVLIGPEGGFSDQERSLLHAMENSVAVSLGPRILRAETAAIAALSCVQAFFGDW